MTYLLLLSLFSLVLFMLYFAIILPLFACIAPMVEQFHGKEEVTGSTPVVSTTAFMLQSLNKYIIRNLIERKSK